MYTVWWWWRVMVCKTLLVFSSGPLVIFTHLKKYLWWKNYVQHAHKTKTTINKTEMMDYYWCGIYNQHGKGNGGPVTLLFVAFAWKCLCVLCGLTHLQGGWYYEAVCTLYCVVWFLGSALPLYTAILLVGTEAVAVKLTILAHCLIPQCSNF